MLLRDFKVTTEGADIYFSLGKPDIPVKCFYRHVVITCYITMKLITAYGKLITCLSAELN